MKISKRIKKNIYNETINDLKQIWTSCYPKNKSDPFPSNSILILIGSFMDIWGSIAGKRFNIKNKTKENVELVLTEISGSNTGYEEIFTKKGEIKTSILKIVRSKATHAFAREWLNPSVSLNGGKVFEYKWDAGENRMRWNINIERLYKDSLEFAENENRKLN